MPLTRAMRRLCHFVPGAQSSTCTHIIGADDQAPSEHPIWFHATFPALNKSVGCIPNQSSQDKSTPADHKVPPSTFAWQTARLHWQTQVQWRNLSSAISSAEIVALGAFKLTKLPLASLLEAPCSPLHKWTQVACVVSKAELHNLVHAPCLSHSSSIIAVPQ